jgi:hypothetical protein
VGSERYIFVSSLVCRVMADRNEVLANFQALSNIEDIAICLDILEAKGWDLMAAVNSVLPENNYSHSTPAVHLPPLQARGAGVVDLTGNGTSSNGSVSQPHVVDLTRDPLHSTHTLPNNHPHPLLPRFDVGVGPAHPGPGPSITHHFPPHIGSSFHYGSPLQPHLPPPPPHADDDEEGTVQSQQAPDPPITVSSSPASSAYGDACDHPNNTEGEDDEEEEEDMEDTVMDSLSFDGDFSHDDSARKAMKEPLIPETCVEVTEALQFFTSRFEGRYGAMHPLFFIGALKEAVREATSGVGTHKPMLIYLHHDASILSNIFCSNLLCSESVVSYLTSNYITWAWDLTSPRHRKQLLDMIGECFGQMARARVNDIHSDHLPVILIVSKVQGSVDVRNIIQGETNLDGLMTSLITAVEEHSVQIETEKREERERVAREMMIAEQNAAYQESLAADREKLKRKEQQMLQEEEDRQEREAVRQSMASVVPGEPADDTEEKISTLRIRLPNGTTAHRRFLARNTLQVRD